MKREHSAHREEQEAAERGEEWQLTSVSNCPNIIFATLGWKSLNTENDIILNLNIRNVLECLLLIWTIR